MIKKFAALGATVAAVTSVIVLASLVPASSHGAITKRFTLCEQNNTGYSKSIDVGRHGFSAGDYALNSTPAYHAGQRVGRDVGKQTIVRLIGKHDARFIVDATMILHAGKISAYGPARFSAFDKGVSFPVTGGTGLYRKAVGTVRVVNGHCVGKGGIRLSFRLAIK
ncbi:MAG TPA: hypothetical protein VHV50_02260 [Actinomycetota bacterium]|jgi:hypothetical protein|nr:hypothetical protein [Actinomycetota bacterium]